MSTLYIVATPIGNLRDITIRALEILKEVDLILSEDTRVTRKLLEHYEIKTPTLSYHQHSKLKKLNYIIKLLKEGKNLALVSDAGTPGISDPGGKLIAAITKFTGVAELRSSPASLRSAVEPIQVKIVAVPGPSAVTAAASISGFSMDKFLFLGFPPTKRKRKKFFEKIISSEYPVIFYESSYRIIKTLKELKQIFQVSLKENKFSTGQASFKLQVVACRELTKKFETIYRGNIEEVLREIKTNKIKGEFVVIVKNPQK